MYLVYDKGGQFLCNEVSILLWIGEVDQFSHLKIGFSFENQNSLTIVLVRKCVFSCF